MICLAAFGIFLALSNSVAYRSQALDCDFESDDLCGFTFDLSADFNWTRSNFTPSVGTGPSSDHTHGDGWFMYLETSWPRLNKEKARLVSPNIDIFSNCLEFHYHMLGDMVNTLNVYLRTSLGDALIWTISKNQGDVWNRAQVSLASSALKSQVVFEGIVGPGYRGDIAIDDVSITYNHLCGLFPTTADPHVPTPTPTPQPSLKPQSSFCGRKSGARIVGGSSTQPGDWPWLAMLLYKDVNGTLRQFCGGTLIYPNIVLTAAHCVVDSGDERGHVRMGAYYTDTSQTVGSEQDFDVVKIIYHPDYNAESPYNNDIALLQLHKNVVSNLKVNFACLPKSGYDFPSGTMCYLAGWGDLKSGGDDPDHMMHVQVPVVSNAMCTANGSYHESLITSQMLCAGFKEGGKDTCQGDSGGPLMCKDNNGRWHIVGITSWGYGCAVPNYYGVYARVGNFIDWIASTVQSIEQSTIAI